MSGSTNEPEIFPKVIVCGIALGILTVTYDDGSERRAPETPRFYRLNAIRYGTRRHHRAGNQWRDSAEDGPWRTSIR
jgi:hypothetical protein